MSYHTCPKCGEEDAIEMKMDTPPEPDVNAGATYALVAIYCSCADGDISGEQWDVLEAEASARDADNPYNLL